MYHNTTKIPDDLKVGVLSISCAVQPVIEEEGAKEIEGMLNAMSVLNQVTPGNKQNLETQQREREDAEGTTESREARYQVRPAQGPNR